MVNKNKTSLSLLDGLYANDPAQWERFVELYSPLVYEWCRRKKVESHNAADVVQNVFRAVVLNIGNFKRDCEGDTFHGWLWGITRYKLLDYFRAQVKRPNPAGGTSAQIRIHDIPDDLPESFDESQLSEDSRLIYRRALELLKTDFKPNTWQAFWKVTIDNRIAGDVADELQMSVGAVYNAKYKVLNRLKMEFAELL